MGVHRQVGSSSMLSSSDPTHAPAPHTSLLPTRLSNSSSHRGLAFHRAPWGLGIHELIQLPSPGQHREQPCTARQAPGPCPAPAVCADPPEPQGSEATN